MPIGRAEGPGQGPDGAGPDATLLGAALADVQLGLDLLYPDEHLDPERIGDQVMPAVLVNKRLDHLIEAIFAQARAAFVQVLADLGTVRRVQLPVQVRVDLV